MALYSKQKGGNGLDVSMKEPFEGDVTNTECKEKHEATGSSKDLSKSASSAESNTTNVPSFTTNHNSVVCLPLVSEGLKLVWTQADQTRELDAIPELVQAFNLYPYPSSKEVSALARACALPLDKVKVWFMVQRIKYGISWSSEEIEETQRKLALAEVCDDLSGKQEVTEVKSKHSDEMIVDDSSDKEEVALSSSTTQKKTPKCESPDSQKQVKTVTPCFSSTLPPPEDSYFYRSPVDKAASPASDAILDLTDTSERSTQPHRHSRYKKSKVQLAALRKSFLRENWPAEPELRRLQEETGLSRNDIRKWFSDSRYQLRVGRGTLAAAQNVSNRTTSGVKPQQQQQQQQQQSQPLQLINQKSRQQNGVKRHVVEVHSNEIRNSHFFQTFLSNSLEAFGERVLEAQGSSVIEDLSEDEDEEPIDEEPLQLTKAFNTEPDTPLETLSIPMSSPHSSHSASPPLTVSPSKTLSSKNSTPKKSGISAKARPSQTPEQLSGASNSTSPTLTPAGRPRKTKEQLDVLKQHFLKCQWPKSEEYTELVKLTSLPRADIIQWFGDTRYAVKNGQLRWVKGVRDQFLAELANQQSSNGLTNGSGTSAHAGSRKRKSTANSTNLDAQDLQPLKTYFLSMGSLHEKDLDSLCKKSRMSYQQVRDWFAAQDVVETESIL